MVVGVSGVGFASGVAAGVVVEGGGEHVVVVAVVVVIAVVAAGVRGFVVVRNGGSAAGLCVVGGGSVGRRFVNLRLRSSRSRAMSCLRRCRGDIVGGGGVVVCAGVGNKGGLQ